MEHEDLKLVRGILSGNKGSFDIFFGRYFQTVYSCIHLQVQDHSRTEVLAEEVLVRAVESLEINGGNISLDCWIYRIVRNVLMNREGQKFHVRGKNYRYQQFATGDSSEK